MKSVLVSHVVIEHQTPDSQVYILLKLDVFYKNAQVKIFVTRFRKEK